MDDNDTIIVRSWEQLDLILQDRKRPFPFDTTINWPAQIIVSPKSKIYE